MDLSNTTRSVIFSLLYLALLVFDYFLKHFCSVFLLCVSCGVGGVEDIF